MFPEIILDPIIYTSPPKSSKPGQPYCETVLIRDFPNSKYGPVEGYVSAAIHIDAFHTQRSNPIYDALNEGKKVRVKIQMVEIIDEENE